MPGRESAIWSASPVGRVAASSSADPATIDMTVSLPPATIVNAEPEDLFEWNLGHPKLGFQQHRKQIVAGVGKTPGEQVCEVGEQFGQPRTGPSGSPSAFASTIASVQSANCRRSRSGTPRKCATTMLRVVRPALRRRRPRRAHPRCRDGRARSRESDPRRDARRGVIARDTRRRNAGGRVGQHHQRRRGVEPDALALAVGDGEALRRREPLMVPCRSEDVGEACQHPVVATLDVVYRVVVSQRCVHRERVTPGRLAAEGELGAGHRMPTIGVCFGAVPPSR